MRTFVQAKPEIMLPILEAETGFWFWGEGLARTRQVNRHQSWQPEQVTAHTGWRRECWNPVGTEAWNSGWQQKRSREWGRGLQQYPHLRLRKMTSAKRKVRDPSPFMSCLSENWLWTWARMGWLYKLWGTRTGEAEEVNGGRGLSPPKVQL